MKDQIVINKVLRNNITQQELGEFLGLTRQSISRIQSGGYVRISEKARTKLEKLMSSSDEDILKIIRMNRLFEEIKDRVFLGETEYINFAFEGLNYMHYWICDPKFINQERFHIYYFAHLNNFYPRFNQAALFMRDMFNKQELPLLTFQIDYSEKTITNACIKAFNFRYFSKEYDLKDVTFPISISAFFLLIKERIQPQARFLLYRDYMDDDWEFLIQHSKKSEQPDYEMFDLSRLFNFFDNQKQYYGPLLEFVLEQFKIDYEIDRLLQDCHYRAEKIVELINMVSLEELANQKHEKIGFMFDSHGLKRDNNFMQKERRKQKEMKK